MLTTDDDGLSARARSVRFHGEDRTRGIQDRIGSDWLMTEFQAALGLVQVRRLENSVARRMEIASRYDDAFKNMEQISIFPLPENSTSGYYKYPVLLRQGISYADVKQGLDASGISAGTAYWPSIHLQPVYRRLFGFKEGDYPVAENILPRVITLPLYPAMDDDEVELVIRSFRDSVAGL
jgi:dTDP-4-amino-4,6-dideoxygalactose transaminase